MAHIASRSPASRTPGILAIAGALAAISSHAQDAEAAIVTAVGGVFHLTVPPPSCLPGALLTLRMAAWDELTNVPGPLHADMVLNPSNSNAPLAGLITGQVNSHFLHWEVHHGIAMIGSVTFDQPIVGLAFTDALLDISDAVAGLPGTAYPTLIPTRGSLLLPGGSVATINPTGTNPNRLDLSIHTAGTGPNPGLDFMQMRVFTAVPAPASCAALASLLIASRRRSPR